MANPGGLHLHDIVVDEAWRPIDIERRNNGTGDRAAHAAALAAMAASSTT
jgi:hypothetical protein